MSANGNGNGDEDIPGREIAYRVFAAEYDDADFSYAESDEERAPNYVITPTGARLNRIFAVGTLTEITPVNDDMVRARVVDPTGAFVVYAGQYQPDELAALEQLDPPAFVAVTGKARTFQPEDSDVVYTSVRPESIATVDGETRDRWVVNAAEQTLDRIGTYAQAAELDATGETLSQRLENHGVENGRAAGIPLARDHYETTADYLAALRDCALEAVEVVAGDRDQVSPLDIGPSGTRPTPDVSVDDLAPLAELTLTDTGSGESIDSGADKPIAEPDTATGVEPAGTDDLAGSAAGTASAQLEPDEESESVTTEASAASDDDEETTVPAGASGTRVERDDTETGTESEDTETAVESEDTAAPKAETGDAVTSTDTADDVTAAATETATDVDPTQETDDELGDFDSGATDTTKPVDSADDEPDTDDELGDFDGGDGMYEMDEEEREQIEAEFGTEFTTGTDVDDPGESDIDVPTAEDDDTTTATDTTEATPADDASEDDATEESTAEQSEAVTTAGESGTATAAEEPDGATDTDEAGDKTETDDAADVDLQEYVVDTMVEIDDGDGADRTELIETVTSDIGAGEEDVEDAIQDALMGGQCYEPDDGTLKPI